jgi:hypothetical protein
MKSHTTSLLIGLAMVLAIVAVPAHGADALVNCTSGVPFAYPGGGADILWNPDLGGLGPLTNGEAVTAVGDAFARWENISTSSATFLQGPFVATDIDLTNFVPVFNGLFDGESPIVFDEDGSIFDLLFGAGSGILGFAGPDFGNFVTCELLEGSAFLNGPEFDDAIVAEDIMVHEFGHYINLGHVELNGQLANFSEGGDDSGPTPDNTTFGTADLDGTELIETMYPFYFSNIDAGTRTPHADDIAAISTIYPAPSFADMGSISGAVLAPNGTTRLSGVNVIARNINDPFADAVSTFSGAYTDSTSQADPNTGLFTLSGLTPGGQYAVFVDRVTAAPGRFSNPIMTQLPGPEEFWNDGDESSDPSTDDPGSYVLITASAAGAPGTDIIFNQPGEGDPLLLGDDGSVSLFLPFTFTLCDQEFDQVFVNANGNLTFGAGDSDFTESAAEFLNEAPRIAGLWDDLSPFNLFTGVPQGVVYFSTTNNTFSVSWEDVPEFPDVGANSFTITLKKDSDEIFVDYGNIDAGDGLAGISCGIDVTGGLEQETELVTVPNSRTINVHDQTAVYETFAGSDLDFYSLRYANQRHALKDRFEPNDSIAKASPVSTPFNTAPNELFTAIAPAAADVDYYSFAANEGETVIAETVRGNLDTVMALFDSSGALLAFDDDGGTALLSRIQASIPADGIYYLAVTFCCDYDFDGVDPGQGLPFDGGRYVLDIQAFLGTPLFLGDDDSEEVALGFGFPFQGATYNSVFVNSNGSLTFGGGDTDFSESVSEFLNENPRIAPLWDDLSPNQGGLVLVDGDSSFFTVSFTDVPQFIAGDSNNFTVTLEPDGSVSIAYGGVDATDGLVGVTEGGGAADPGETDLSAGGPYSVSGTTYEQFSSSDNDLDGLTLEFDP